MKFEKLFCLNRRTYYPCVCDICGSFFKRRNERNEFRYCVSCSNAERGKAVRIHGENNRNSRLHVVWNNMLNRCRNERNKRYSRYGGRGISVCDEWLSYVEFRDWARLNGYSDELTIDRIDNNGNYNPDNCRFVDKSYQNANRGATKTNTSGVVGVWANKNTFCSRVVYRGSIYNLGSFKTIKEAAIARDEFIKKNEFPHQLSPYSK